MKNLKWLILLLTISTRTTAQDFPGYRASNYTGVNGVFFNPANIADSRYRWDLNLFSAGAIITNSNASFTFKELRNFEDDKIKTQLFGKQADAASGLLSGNITGPSLMFRAGKKMSFAFTTRVRAMLNAGDLDGKLASKIIDHVANDEELPYGIHSASNMTAAANGWTEFGVSGGRVLANKERHFLKGGISLKYLAGAVNGHMYINKLNATLDEDAITKNYLVTNATGSIGVGFGGGDISKNFRPGDLLKFNGSGLGADIGFVYEFRPESGKDSGPGKEYNNRYKVKIGVALLDIGAMKYTKNKESSGAYNIDISGTEQFDLSTLNSLDPNEINGFLAERPEYFTPVAENEKDIKVSLPTTLQLDADYHIQRGFFVNIAGQIALNGVKDKPYNNQYYNGLTLTPRYEGKAFGLYIPVNYNTLTHLNAGLSVRAGPFFMGSGSALTALLGNSRQADFHFGVHLYGLCSK